MAKYMAKSLDGEVGTQLNRKRYATSKGVECRLRVTRRWLPAGVKSWRDALAEFCAAHWVNLDQKGCRFYKVPDAPVIWIEYAPDDPGADPVPF